MKVNQSKLFTWLIFLFVTSIGIILSLYLSIKIQDRFNHNQTTQFLLLASSRLHEIELALNDFEDTLNAIAALYYSSDEVTEADFNRFIDEAFSHRGKFYMLGWVPRVTEQERASYEQAAQKWDPHFQILKKNAHGHYDPSPQRTIYYPLYYIAPQKDHDYRYGEDFTEENDVWKVFKKALANPEKTLVDTQFKDENQKKIHILLVKAIENIKKIEGANSNKGFVIGSIKLTELFDELLKNPISYLNSQSASLYVFDESLNNETKLIYSHHNSSPLWDISFKDLSTGKVDQLHMKKEVKFGDKKLTILNTSNEPIESLISKESLLALFLGLTTTSLAGFSVWLLSNQANKEASSVYLKEIMEQQAKELEVARKNSSALLEQFKLMHEKLISQEKLVSLGELAAGIAHEVRNPLNLVNNFSKMSVELFEELKEKLSSKDQSEQTRKETEELCVLLQENMHKIHNQGQRAERVIEGVLAIAREKSGEKRMTSLPELLEDAINLSYQAMRAKDSSFNVKIEKDFDNVAKNIECISEDLRRVFINLLNNAFYSINAKKKITSPYQPLICVKTQNMGDKISITIKDNGTGIPEEVKNKLFTPFFTTKPLNEGTGLGLSLSKEIIVQRHHGELIVESNVNEDATFKIILPKVSTR